MAQDALQLYRYGSNSGRQRVNLQMAPLLCVAIVWAPRDDTLVLQWTQLDVSYREKWAGSADRERAPVPLTMTSLTDPSLSQSRVVLIVTRSRLECIGRCRATNDAPGVARSLAVHIDNEHKTHRDIELSKRHQRMPEPACKFTVLLNKV